MAKNPLIKRYLDAGMAFTQMTQSRAEAIVKDLVKQGEVKSKQAEELIDELLERSRANTEGLLELVRTEVRDQLVSLGLLNAETGTPPAPAATKRSTPKKAPAKGGATGQTKAAAKKSAAKKSPAKRTTAKKTAAKRSPAKKAGAKRSPAKKTATKKAAPGSPAGPSAS